VLTNRSVALLRGINVGTQPRIGMAPLREHSGSFSGGALEAAIAETFGVSPRVLLLSASEFRAVAAEIPIREIADDPSRGFVYFMEAVPASLVVPPDLAPEVVVVGELGVYQWAPEGVSKSKVKPSFVKSLGPTATARNLRTVDALLAMLDA
jgi:uncharacterized protein (DUF1697 family)